LYENAEADDFSWRTAKGKTANVIVRKTALALVAQRCPILAWRITKKRAFWKAASLHAG
jgi:hypothetical protein